MPEPSANRLLKKPLKAEFTRIYISFYNSFTMKGNAVAYVWICEVKQFLLIKIFKKRSVVAVSMSNHKIQSEHGENLKTLPKQKHTIYQNKHIRL
jgi:hypothetical protein